MTKTCSVCKLDKPIDEFHNYKLRKDGKAGRCKLCDAEYTKEWQRKNPERAAEQWRKDARKAAKKSKARKYGITLDRLEELLSETNCGICDRSFGDMPPHIDHDHTTGIVRGMLCINCNTGIGNLRDDVAILRKAIDYLEASLV